MIDTKLLRQKILDLAIRGKLVPQNPADEPASELLKKIKAEKEELVKAGKIKKDKHESFIFKGDDNRYYETIDGKTADITAEIPFELPDSWVWCRVENIGLINPRNKISDDTVVSFMPMTQLGAGYGSNYDLSERTWDNVKSGFTHFAENDIVFAKITPCFQNRKSAVMRGLKNGYGAGTTELHVIRCLADLIPDYVLLLVKNQSFISDAVATIQGVVGQQRIDANFVKKYLFPLPPFGEQKRIVSRIDALLKYADSIDADAETLEKSITLAKQKILDLAIRGKLVPQDPTDEPASELLKKIKAEKEALIKAGKIKKDKHESFIFKGDDNCYYETMDGNTTDITDEIPFGLPDNWAWCRLREIGNILYGVSESAKTNGCYKLLRITDIQNDSVNWQTVPFTDFSGDAATYFLRDGDIVFARTGATVGKSFLIESAPQNAIYASYLIRVRFIFATVAKFIKNFFGSSVYWEQIVTKSVGTGQPNVNGTSLSDLFLPIPPLAEQKRIVSQVEKLFAVLETMRG